MSAALVDHIKSFPDRPGIYRFYGATGDVLYVGKALSLKNRVMSYVSKDINTKTQTLMSQVTKADFVETGSEFEALLLEARLIKLHRPKYNIIFKDDKSYLYIFISTGEEFPKILVTRKPKLFGLSEAPLEFESLKGIFFGPFPSASTTRGVLKLVRRIFPYCSQRQLSKRGCFYSHIGLCDPCPSEIVKLPEDERKRLTQDYRKNIFHIKHILEGKISELRKLLETEMNRAAKSEDFETAARVRNQLAKLEYVTQGKDTTKSFLANENFHFERQKQASVELRDLLAPYFEQIEELRKLECYDISNLGGTHAVGAQVVFVDGVPEKNLYRKYRIRMKGPADPQMMSEMLSRRLKHTEWTYPDLIVVDGGKTQVSAATKTLTAVNQSIPVIGLAKRLEKIVVPTRGFKEVILPRRSEALRLLMQMRDETHRFAHSYHAKRKQLAFQKENK